MAYRFTNTDKWNDSWFYQLKPLQKLLFIYLCDNCDIAGFIEINLKKWVSDINSNNRDLEGALKGLARGLIYSETNDCIYIRTFLRHQKNLPLNEKNKAHLGIMKRFELYSYKFNIQSINEFIQGALKGLQCPLGIGNGIGIGNGKNEPQKKQIPTFEEFKSYGLENKKDISIENLELKYNSWVENGWKTGNNKLIKNWKSTLLNTIPYLNNKNYGTNKQTPSKKGDVNELWENHTP